ncbi:MAG: thermonuclease family protein [Ketobacter sp.]|nr:thermonuclease family protein [Ketobacter sp.]
MIGTGYAKPQQGQYAYFAIDGDTLARVDLYNPDKRRLVRIIGLDTPETKRAKCKDEKIKGYEAKARMQELVVRHSITLVPVKRKDKYGRLLATVYADGKDVAKIMISEGLGRAYSGKSRREGWC